MLISSLPVLVFLLLNLKIVWTAKILAFFVVYPQSHMTVKSTLFRELALRGHNVTVVSPVADKNPPPNYEEIVVDETLGPSRAYANNIFKKRSEVETDLAFFIWERGRLTCEMVLKNPEIQRLIHSRDMHYDLVVLEAYFSDCLVPFSKKFNAPMIKISTFSGTPWMTDWVGNPTELSYVPDPFLTYTDKMTFWQRLVNVYTTNYYRMARKYYHMPKIDAIIRKYFNESEELPSLAEMELEMTSLLFLNTHFSITYPRPLLPNVIQIGGLHLKPPEKLPKDLQLFLDSAEHGVVYFSMGSILLSSKFPEPTRRAFLEAFSKMKEKILWKWETDDMPGKPNNVKLSKWLPQSDVLAHPNVRAFMTHGGQMSTMEAIHRGVPVVGIPVFGDQTLNMGRAKSAGLGVTLEFQNISMESVTWALREVLDNPQYRENIQHLSRIFHDKPQHPLDQAVYWTEYVIRHKGAPHLRSAALDLTWYQFYLIDVIAVVALFVILFVAILSLTCVYLYNKLCVLCGREHSYRHKKKIQ